MVWHAKLPLTSDAWIFLLPRVPDNNGSEFSKLGGGEAIVLIVFGRPPIESDFK